MTLLRIFAAVAVGCLALFPIVLWSDKRWYKKHPGAEEEFGRIDQELESKGK